MAVHGVAGILILSISHLSAFHVLTIHMSMTSWTDVLVLRGRKQMMNGLQRISPYPAHRVRGVVTLV